VTGAPVEPDEVIFSVNSGRVGSKYLAELIDTSDEAHGLHEPRPAMKGRYLWMVAAAPEEESFDVRQVKAQAIREWWRQHATKTVYSETNHLFIVTFHDVAVASFPRMKVVYLRRALPRVVKSFVERGFFSDESATWQKWHIVPSAATAAVRPIAPEEELDPVDRIIAHLIDIEARGARFRAAHPEIPCVDVRIEELSRREGVDRLFDAFGLTPTSATEQIVAKGAVNLKEKAKRRVGAQVSEDECRRRIERYLDRAANLGIEVPSSLAVD
jgi:hypothetical protein